MTTERMYRSRLDSFTPFFILYKPTREEVNNIVDRVSRPTTAHCRRSRSFSNVRVRYEAEENQRVKRLTFRDYAKNASVPKHYGGTRKTVKPDQLDDLVRRINKPTLAYNVRAFPTEEQSRPQSGSERQKSAVSRGRSAAPSERRPMTSPPRTKTTKDNDGQD